MTIHNCPNCNVPLRKEQQWYKCPYCPFNYVPNQKFLETLYAWISVDPKTGYEGLIAMPIDGVAMPLINSNKKTIMEFSSQVKKISKTMNMEIKLAEFTRTT